MTLSLPDLLVLIVEPSNMQRKAITRLLESRGLTQFEYASTGSEAFERLVELTPDLVVSALYLDDLTGSDLVRAMRREKDLARVPFILVSSETRFKPLDPIKQAGVVAVVGKQNPEETLDAALESTLAYLQPQPISIPHQDIETIKLGLVDDSRMARSHMRRTLEELGFKQIFEANDGKLGQQLISEQNLDTLITDLHMPEFDGQQLCRWVRQESNQPELPILGVTSEVDPVVLQDFRESGANEVCTKPFDINQLKQLLPDLLS